MRRDTLFWAILLILAGLLLLAGNLGLFDRLEINVWNLLWPLFLIVLGGWFIFNALAGPGPVTVQDAAIPLEGAARAEIKIGHGAGRLLLSGGAAAGQLVAGSFAGGLDYRAKREGDMLKVKMGVPSRSGFIFPWSWSPGALDWTVHLSEDVPLALKFETGASRSEIDLTDLKVTTLEIETGASATAITLPARAGFTKADIEAGAASVDVRVPGGVAARIVAKSGLSSVRVDQTRFPGSGSRFESPDYATAANKVEIELETGVGSVSVS